MGRWLLTGTRAPPRFARGSTDELELVEQVNHCMRTPCAIWAYSGAAGHGEGSGSIRPHLSVLLLTGVLAGLLCTSVPSVPTPLPQGEVGSASPPPFQQSCPPALGLCGSRAALVGRVGYLGGKSDAVVDARWGVPAVVTARRSSTSGESLPFGLDCSGRIWCAVNAAGDPAALPPGAAACGPAGPVRPGGLGRRPRRSGLLSDHPMWDRGRPGKGRSRLLVLHFALLPGGVVCPRRQGRGLYRPGPSLLV